MSDRIVRSNILTSETVNNLSWAGEVFYRRLMSIADDFGRFDARPAILRATLYPLKLNQVSEPDIVKWMTECSETGLVRRYEVEDRAYLEILKFGQRLRSMKSKYPPPPASADNCGQMTADVSSSPQKRDGRETETETEVEGKSPPGFSDQLKADELFYEQAAMNWRLDSAAYGRMIDAFQHFLVSKHKEHPNYGEYKSHFFNWGAKKHIDYQKRKKVMVD